LCQRSIENINEEYHQKKLATLLRQYENVFARNRLDLGTCSMIKHQIETKNAAPIRQQLRRTPKAFEKEEEVYLKEQLEAGVITPSTSAWASPLVLVQKKDQTV
jgi:hypothetical protein